MSAQSSLDPDALPQIIGDFRPVDQWQIHINDVFYGLRGNRLREFYQTFASADYRLAYALAGDYYRRLGQRDQRHDSGGDNAQQDAESALIVMEWGCGNGNLAACFLDRFKELDVSGRYYPRLQYQLIDKNAVVLEEQMMKIAKNQIEYQTVTNMYQKMRDMFKTAIGN